MRIVGPVKHGSIVEQVTAGPVVEHLPKDMRWGRADRVILLSGQREIIWLFRSGDKDVGVLGKIGDQRGGAAFGGSYHQKTGQGHAVTSPREVRTAPAAASQE